MKRTVLIVLACWLFQLIAFPQASQEELDKALLPAPGNLKAAATVIKWKPDFTYDTLRKGTNRLVCYDRSGQPGQQPFAAECTSLGNLDRVAQSLKIEAMGDKDKVRTAFEAAEKAGNGPSPSSDRCGTTSAVRQRIRPERTHDRRSWRHGKDHGAARHQRQRWSVDHECGHVRRPPDDAWRVGRILVGAVYDRALSGSNLRGHRPRLQ